LVETKKKPRDPEIPEIKIGLRLLLYENFSNRLPLKMQFSSLVGLAWRQSLLTKMKSPA
jgi:hypothetical protein